jgi:hypothetical protein
MTARYDLVVGQWQTVGGTPEFIPLDKLDCAVIGQVTWVLNTPWSVSGTVDTLDPKVERYFAQGPEFEYQLLRNNELVMWGPLVRAQPQMSNPEVTDFLIQDPLWYFHKRNCGKAGRTNLLVNPNFDHDPPGTTAPFGWTVAGPTSAEVVTGYDMKGPNAVKLTTASAGQDAYIGQLVAHTTGATEADVAILTVLAQVGTDFSGPAGPNQEQRGVYLGVLDGSGNQIGDPQYVPITNATGQGTLLTLQIGALMPEATSGHFDVRLYGPGGSIVYGACSLVFEESLSTPLAGEDQSITIGRLVDYFQGRGPLGDGKSDLNIGHNSTLSNVNRIQSYQFAAHDEGLQVLQQYPAMADGVDFAMTFPDRHTRTFWIYGATVNDAVLTSGSNVIQSTAAAITLADKYQPVYHDALPIGTVITGVVDATHFTVSNPAGYSDSGATIGIRPRKGSYKPDWPLILRKNVILGQSQILLDAEQGGTDFIELGTEQSSVMDNGAARPEGGAANSALLGGLTLMVVEQAPSNLSINALDSLARRRLDLMAGIPLTAKLRVKDDAWFENVFVGDLVPVHVPYGWVNLEGDYRVTQIDLLPGGSGAGGGDVLDVTLGLPVL